MHVDDDADVCRPQIAANRARHRHLTHSKIHASCEECETREGMLDQFDRVISIEGALDADQRKRLMEIADKCPVHRTLTSEVRILTKAAV